MNEKEQGGCLCGAVRYSVEGQPESSIICHCHTCRKASAAPSVAWLTFGKDKFCLQSGFLAEYHSSQDVVRSFCPVCGSQITYRSAASPDTIDVSTISLDDASQFPPSREEWTSHAIGWEPRDAMLDQYSRSGKEGREAGKAD
jgi:hypothetical protein